MVPVLEVLVKLELLESYGHTRLMGRWCSVDARFCKIDICSPNIACWMNVTRHAEFLPEQIKENLALHLTHTVAMDKISYGSFTEFSVTFLEFSNKSLFRTTPL